MEPRPIRILGVSGSLRADSYNAAVLRTAAARVPAGVSMSLFDGLRAVPPYDSDDDVDPPPEAVAVLRDAMAAADAVLFATPEYNASIPGVLKNALDWASRPFPDNALRGTPVAVAGATTGSFGAVWAQAELRKVLGTTGARVIEESLAVPRAHERVVDGHLTGDDLLVRLDVLVTALVDEVRAGLAAAA
jgi:chromate reductase